MKKLILSLLLLTALPVNAYDVDTHFYGTYAMARYVGIGHEAAAKIAASTQWMDESYISDPTSMIFLPVTGIHKRRLLHFPSPRVAGTLATENLNEALSIKVELTETQQELVQKVVDWANLDISVEELTKRISLKTETNPADMFATEMYTAGLKRGNLMMAATGIHTLEDSFAHAGTPAEEGHANYWHWPDRPFDDLPKYFEMVRSVMRALVVIRDTLPKAALDCEFVSSESNIPVANCSRRADDLSAEYAQNDMVRNVVGYNVLQDRNYVRHALTRTILRAERAGYIKLSSADKATVAGMIDAATTFNSEMQDSYKSLEFIIKSLAGLDSSRGEKDRILNLRTVVNDLGLFSTEDFDADPASLVRYITNFENSDYQAGLNTFINQMSVALLKWDVPQELTKKHRGEVENDKSPVRTMEMDLRIANMQKLIEDLYGDKVVFIENHTKDARGFYYEMVGDKRA